LDTTNLVSKKMQSELLNFLKEKYVFNYTKNQPNILCLKN